MPGRLLILVVVAGSDVDAPYAVVVIADGPIAYWPQNELSGTAMIDLMGNRLGTYTNVPTLGESGALSNGTKATYWNGTSNYASFPHTALLPNWSLEAWVAADGVQPEFANVISDIYTASVNFALRFNAAGEICVGYYTGGAWHLSGGYAVNDLEMYHVAGTFDGSALRLYINGVLVDTTSSPTPCTSDAAGGVIGRTWNGTVYFKGFLDEVALYDSALGADKWLAHYNARLNTTNILAIADADENGALIFDENGNFFVSPT